ncbi:MAG: hypothetical protein GX599_01195, partial [Chloroflexi bacterium]|nr:hypothetical protein [Chloroflexota bacterium]
LKVLSKEPSARYRTADQLGRLLMGFYESELSVPITNENLNQLSKLEKARPNPLPIELTPTPVPAPNRSAAAPEAVKATQEHGRSSQTNRTHFSARQSAQAEPTKPAIDWKTWSLGLLAAALLLGLVPFWFYVYILLKP